MKPMILLIAVGVAFLVTMVVLGTKNFDGVVEDKTYEASLKYDETIADVAKIDYLFGKLSANRLDQNIVIHIELGVPKNDIGDFSIQNAVLTSPGRDISYPLEKSEGSYKTNKDISSGMYNIHFHCLLNDKKIKITKTLYID